LSLAIQTFCEYVVFQNLPGKRYSQKQIFNIGTLGYFKLGALL